jgi:3-(methylthio)propionyl---CoA ligase
MASALPEALNCWARDVILPVVPMFHVNAWGLPYAAFMVGAKLVFPGPLLDGKSLHDLFEAEGMTVSAGVPTVWQGLLAHVETNNLAFSTMRAHDHRRIGLSAGDGARVPGTLRRAGAARLGHDRTRAARAVCTLKPRQLGLDNEQRLAIQAKQGRAVFGIDLKIVDDDGQALPHDGRAPGELLVRGPWVISR